VRARVSAGDRAGVTRVDRGDVSLAVFESGAPDGPPVLLVHGYPDTHAVWDDVAAHLAPSHRVIAYDVRGAGASSHPRDDAAYDLEELADDMAAVIDAVSPGRAVHLVGHDWGSIAAWELCTTARADRRIASFTSISGPCLDHAGRWVADALAARALGTLATQAIRSWYIAALKVPGLPAWLWPRLAPRFPAILARVEGTPRVAAPTLAADGIAGAALYRQNVAARVRRPRADAIARVPVQLVVPRRDHYVAGALIDQVPGWAPSLVMRELDAGHWAPRTRPALIARWIAEQVAEHERERAA